MRLLFCGDIVGRAGRDVVVGEIPRLREALRLDFVIANAENAAHGFGVTPQMCRDFYEAGIDGLTLGNHAWDKREIIGAIDADARLVRPANYPPGTPGRGATVLAARDGRRLLVVNVMGRLFMDPLDDPFAAVGAALDAHPLGEAADAVLVDFHAEATSEKMAMGHFADGRASLVVGTHTHVPTADAQILPGGTAYQSDAGMCGNYDSVIGMKKDRALYRFLRRMPGPDRQEPADGAGTLCGVFVETDDRTGLARRIDAVRIGPRLAAQTPAEANDPR